MIRRWLRDRRYVRRERDRMRRVLRASWPEVTDEGVLERWNVRSERLVTLREQGRVWHGAGMSAILAGAEVMVDETFREMKRRGIAP